MPCYDGRPPQTETEARIGKAVSALRHSLEFLGRPVPELVESQYRNGYPNDRRIEPMLCELLSDLKANAPGDLDRLLFCDKYWAKDLNQWWTDHQIQDAVLEGKESPYPERQQTLLETAIKKLTRIEAALLGLVDKWDEINNFTPSDKE